MSELSFQCIIARQEREKNLLKPTNKGTDKYTDAQALHYFTLGDSGCMQQAVSPNLAPWKKMFWKEITLVRNSLLHSEIATMTRKIAP